MFFLNLFLSYFFYLLGDLFSKIPLYFCYFLYSKFMSLSVKFDEKCGYKIWKE
jgi:hypothetical protein